MRVRVIVNRAGSLIGLLRFSSRCGKRTPKMSTSVVESLGVSGWMRKLTVVRKPLSLKYQYASPSVLISIVMASVGSVVVFGRIGTGTSRVRLGQPPTAIVTGPRQKR